MTPLEQESSRGSEEMQGPFQGARLVLRKLRRPPRP